MNREKGKYRRLFFNALSARYLIVLSVFIAVAQTALIAQQKKIGEKNIAFIEYPDFPDAHSTWGSIGYNPVHNTVYIGVTNHKDNIALYEYAVLENEMRKKGFIKDLGLLRSFQWQGKIHSKIISGPDGSVYFTTDGGESREEYLMNHPHGYGGGFFMKWDPETETITNLGAGLPYESIKDIDIDPHTGILYGITYPQARFLVYDIKNNDMKDMGRLASAHVPRVIFTDQWGNCYYVDWRLRLVKYEKSTGQLVFAEHSLPTFEGTPGDRIITGIKTYAKDDRTGTIYLITYAGKVVSFIPKEMGIGKVKDLGGVFEIGKENKWGPVSNLNFGDNGKLYYFIGGHRRYVKEDTTVLVELDPESGKRKIIYEFPVDVVSEATGSDIRDSEGNIYFAGRRRTKETALITGSEDGYSKPFMIKFNPEKEVLK